MAETKIETKVDSKEQSKDSSTSSQNDKNTSSSNDGNKTESKVDSKDNTKDSSVVTLLQNDKNTSSSNDGNKSQTTTTETKVDSKETTNANPTNDGNKSQTTTTETQKTESKEQEVAIPTTLQGFIDTLQPQEQKILKNFIQTSIFDSFMNYIENFYNTNKKERMYRMSCYCFRAKDDFTYRIHDKIYTIKKGDTITIPKDVYGNALLRNQHVERIL